jgi:hypothetical protein
MFSNWAWMLYTIAIPALLLLVVLFKIANEIYFATHVTFLLIFNILIFVCIVVSIALYLSLIHRGK